MSRAAILVVGREALSRWPVAERLKSDGYKVLEADTAQAVADTVADGIDVVMLDGPLDDSKVMLRRIREVSPRVPVILLTAGAAVDGVVEAMKLGAYHVANRPFDLANLTAIVKGALETTRLQRELLSCRGTAACPYSPSRMVGASAAVTALRALVARVATSPSSTVLLIGESGTGKDLAARIIHYMSARASQPFIDITCSALPEQLLETELFGHEPGAFTDAGIMKRGLLEIADGGTVFLDEISEMTPALQGKLLQFLEERCVRRIGGSHAIAVNVRVIAATNRDLGQEVANQRFREDLFYRLNVLPIVMPPLRTHREDIPLLVECFIDGFNSEFGKRVTGLTSEAQALLRSYWWPGNVRQLRNVLERAVLLSDTRELDVPDFPSLPGPAGGGSEFQLPPTGVDLEQLERSLVIQALRRSSGNQTRAGSLLGLNRDQIRYRIGKFGLTPAGLTGIPPMKVGHDH